MKDVVRREKVMKVGVRHEMVMTKMIDDDYGEDGKGRIGSRGVLSRDGGDDAYCDGDGGIYREERRGVRVSN